MKKLVVTIVIGLVIMVACQKKTIPVITSRTEFPKPPPIDTSKVIENSQEAIVAGKTLYMGKCNRCHDLASPSLYTWDRWVTILQLMIPRARLNEEEAKQLRSYVMAHAKKTK